MTANMIQMSGRHNSFFLVSCSPQKRVVGRAAEVLDFHGEEGLLEVGFGDGGEVRLADFGVDAESDFEGFGGSGGAGKMRKV